MRFLTFSSLDQHYHDHDKHCNYFPGRHQPAPCHHHAIGADPNQDRLHRGYHDCCHKDICENLFSRTTGIYANLSQVQIVPVTITVIPAAQATICRAKGGLMY